MEKEGQKKEKELAKPLQTLIRTVVTKPDGTVMYDSGTHPSRSFVIQFLEFVYGISGGAGNYLQVTATNNTEQYIYMYNQETAEHFFADAPVNVSNHGIVVGTGDTAVDNTDYKLETQLGEGVGAGQITHGAMVFVATVEVGANIDFVLKRSFVNNTGSTITVKEAGVYVRNLMVPTQHCIIRDVLGVPIDVPDKCALTVYYTIRTTV